MLLRHPSVLEAVTVAIEDSDFGEVPMSMAVISAPVSEIELTAHARACLEPLKVSKRIFIVEQIPRGESGKAKLREVQALIANLLERDRTSPTLNGDVHSGVLQVAAQVFRVAPEMLTIQSTAADVEGWDSFSQINLILALEAKFDISIKASAAASLRRLSEFAEAVSRARR